MGRWRQVAGARPWGLEPTWRPSQGFPSLVPPPCVMLVIISLALPPACFQIGSIYIAYVPNHKSRKRFYLLKLCIWREEGVLGGDFDLGIIPVAIIVRPCIGLDPTRATALTWPWLHVPALARCQPSRARVEELHRPMSVAGPHHSPPPLSLCRAAKCARGLCVSG